MHGQGLLQHHGKVRTVLISCSEFGSRNSPATLRRVTFFPVLFSMVKSSLFNSPLTTSVCNTKSWVTQEKSYDTGTYDRKGCLRGMMQWLQAQVPPQDDQKTPHLLVRMLREESVGYYEKENISKGTYRQSQLRILLLRKERWQKGATGWAFYRCLRFFPVRSDPIYMLA